MCFKEGEMFRSFFGGGGDRRNYISFNIVKIWIVDSRDLIP